MTPEKKMVSLEEFLQMDKENEDRLEYFDGEVVYLESPSSTAVSWLPFNQMPAAPMHCAACWRMAPAR